MATQAQIDTFLRAILGFESGGDPTAQNPKASASGLFGYIDSTWDGFGGYTHAREAPVEVQWAKARLDVAGKLQRYGGDWRKVAMAWYYPAWVNDPSKHNSIPAPEYGNTKTLAQYADLVMSRFTGSKATASATAPGGGTVATTAAPQPKSRQQLLDYIAENYPQVFGLMSINGEVKELLLTAAEKEYSPAKLQAELSKTSWWQKTAKTAREWDASYAVDRATGDAKLRTTRGEIEAQANRLGVTLSAKQLAAMALNVNRLGWTQQEVAESLAGLFRQRNAKPGLGTATVDSLRALAADYGVQLADHTLTVWTQRILGGNADEAGFKSYVVKQAQSLFPTIAGDIGDGMTVRDYFDPYVQSASRILGINPEDVDLSDNKWRRALTRVDPATNKRTPMSLDDWDIELRTNDVYGYDNTATGQRESAAFGAWMAKEVGYA